MRALSIILSGVNLKTKTADGIQGKSYKFIKTFHFLYFEHFNWKFYLAFICFRLSTVSRIALLEQWVMSNWMREDPIRFRHLVHLFDAAASYLRAPGGRKFKRIRNLILNKEMTWTWTCEGDSMPWGRVLYDRSLKIKKIRRVWL